MAQQGTWVVIAIILALLFLYIFGGEIVKFTNGMAKWLYEFIGLEMHSYYGRGPELPNQTQQNATQNGTAQQG